MKGTNIILPYEVVESDESLPFSGDITYLRPDSTTVFLDRDAKKEERFKLFLRNPGVKFPAIIGVSGDGYHFSRPDRTSLIPASPSPESWDRGYVQSVGGVTVIHGDELWIYYIAFAGDPSKKTDTETMRSRMYCNGATGLAKLRWDGFISMNRTGRLLGRSSVFSGVSTNAPLTFPTLRISDLNGTVIRIRFTVEGKLYAFGFADETGDFGGAHAAGIVPADH